MPKPPVDKKFDPQTATLADAQAFLKENAKKGAVCPCCRQKVQLVEREIQSTAARVLIILHHHFQKDSEWLHVPSHLESIARQSGTVQKDSGWARLTYWGLIEEKPKDTGKRAGFYRITEKGNQFAKGEIKLPKYAMVYNDRFLGFTPSCPEVSVTDCLGKEFSYEDLMAGKYSEPLF